MMDDSSEGSSRVLDAMNWRKSTSSGEGECVEVAKIDGEIAVRNSKSPDAGTCYFTPGELGAWIDGCKAGEFDDLMA